MIELKDYLSALDKIGKEKLSPAQLEAHGLVEEGSDNFTNMDQMQELMDSTPEIADTVKIYFEQLETMLPKKTTEKRAPSTFVIPEILKKVMPKHQQELLKSYDKNGKEETTPVLQRLATDIEKLPKRQEADDPTVFAHYFTGGSDWWILEWDRENNLFFGYVCLNGDTQNAELGDISVDEIINLKRIELDFYWNEAPLSEVKHKKYPEDFPLEELEEEEHLLDEEKEEVKKESEEEERLLDEEKELEIQREVEIEKEESKPATTKHAKPSDKVEYKNIDEFNASERTIMNATTGKKYHIQRIEDNGVAILTDYDNHEHKFLAHEAEGHWVEVTGESVSDFKVGDTIVNVYSDQQYQILEFKKDHAMLENLESGVIDKYYFGHNNFALVKAYSGKEAKHNFKKGDMIQNEHGTQFKIVKLGNRKVTIKDLFSNMPDNRRETTFAEHFLKDYTKVKKESKSKKEKPAPKVKAEKPVKKGKYSDAAPVERELESVKMIRRYLGLHLKVKHKDQIMNFIDALQKAITDRRITKEDIHAKEIIYIQKELIKFFNGYKKSGTETVELTDVEIERLSKIAFSEKAMASVAFLKRYIALDGKINMKEKAKKLVADIEKAIKNGTFDSKDKYFKEVSHAHTNLLNYIKNKTKVISVWDAELNGVKDFFLKAHHAAKRVGRKASELYQKAKPHVKKAAASIHKHVSKAIEEHRAKKSEKPKDEGIRFIIARPKGKKTTEVQSITFRTSEWNVPSAERWLVSHGFDAMNVDEKPKSIRFRQHPPKKYTPSSFKTIMPGSKEALGFFPTIIKSVIAATTSNVVHHHMNNHRESINGAINYEKLAKLNVWGLKADEIRTIEEEGNFDGGRHWNFSKVGKKYEAVYDGLYMHVFASLSDLMARKKEIDFYEYNEKKTEERGEETFVNSEGELAGNSEQPVEEIKNVANTNFQDLANLKASHGGFVLKGDIGIMMGNLERNKLAITIEGDKGAGKTQFAFQLADAFASVPLNVGIAELEMPIDGENVKRMRDMYMDHDNLQSGRIKITDKLPNGLQTIRDIANDFDAIIIDSWTKLEVDSKEFDKLRKDFPKTIWIVLFQLASNKQIRGGVAPLFDSGINIEVKKVDNSFRNNYAIATKNRYGQTGLAYNISHKALVDTPE